MSVCQVCWFACVIYYGCRYHALVYLTRITHLDYSPRLLTRITHPDYSPPFHSTLQCLAMCIMIPLLSCCAPVLLRFFNIWAPVSQQDNHRGAPDEAIDKLPTLVYKASDDCDYDCDADQQQQQQQQQQLQGGGADAPHSGDSNSNDNSSSSVALPASSPRSSRRNTECAVCINTFVDGDLCRKLACNHIFHKYVTVCHHFVITNSPLIIICV